MEVLEKPNTNVVTSLFLRVTTESFEGTHNVWLGNNAVAFREPGIHHFTHPVLANRPFIRDTQFRFDRPLYTMQLVVGDQRGAVVPIIFSRSDSPQRREERRGFLVGDLCVLLVSGVSVGVSLGWGVAALDPLASIRGSCMIVRPKRCDSFRLIKA